MTIRLMLVALMMLVSMSGVQAATAVKSLIGGPKPSMLAAGLKNFKLAALAQDEEGRKIPCEAMSHYRGKVFIIPDAAFELPQSLVNVAWARCMAVAKAASLHASAATTKSRTEVKPVAVKFANNKPITPAEQDQKTAGAATFAVLAESNLLLWLKRELTVTESTVIPWTIFWGLISFLVPLALDFYDHLVRSTETDESIQLSSLSFILDMFGVHPARCAVSPERFELSFNSLEDGEKAVFYLQQYVGNKFRIPAPEVTYSSKSSCSVRLIRAAG